LGTGVWQAFLTHSREATATLENFAEDWPKIQSVFSAVRLLHGSIPLAYTLQALCAAAAAITVALIARRRPGAGPEIATLVTAALLTTPYVFDYDLTCLLVPMAYIGACATRGVWLPWEKILLLLLFVLPAGTRAVAMNYGLRWRHCLRCAREEPSGKTLLFRKHCLRYACLNFECRIPYPA
jgi:hypothetical protein